MSNESKRWSAWETLIVGSLLLVIVLWTIPWIATPEKVDGITMWVGGICCALWVGGLLIGVRRHEIVNSSLWNWMPPLFVFRKMDPDFRPILARGLACLQIVIFVYVLVRYWHSGVIGMI